MYDKKHAMNFHGVLFLIEKRSLLVGETADVMKQKLLGDSPVFFCLLWKAVGKMQGKNLFHPYVYRERVQLMKAVQKNALGNFYPHSKNLYQFRLPFFGAGSRDPVKDDPAVVHPLGRIQEVFAAKPRAQGSKVIQCTGGKTFGGGECIPAGDRFPKCFAHPGDDPLDAGNIIVLRDDKGAKRLPWILPEQAYPACPFDRSAHGTVMGQAFFCGFIIGITVKIGFPKGGVRIACNENLVP